MYLCLSEMSCDPGSSCNPMSVTTIQCEWVRNEMSIIIVYTIGRSIMLVIRTVDKLHSQTPENTTVSQTGCKDRGVTEERSTCLNVGLVIRDSVGVGGAPHPWAEFVDRVDRSYWLGRVPNCNKWYTSGNKLFAYRLGIWTPFRTPNLLPGSR